MNFLNNLILWFIPVVVLAVLLLIWRARVRRSQILKSLLGCRWNDPEHVLISPARRSLRLWLFIAGVLLLMAAVARPYWGSQLVPYEARGRDVMVLFDVSKSMLSEDIQPSRLEHAKWLLRQLVNDSNGDRFGLVAFAGNAFLECPMTTDKTSFNQYVDELSTSSIPLGGTNLQLALETAVKAFDAAESTNRAIVLITDGDELSGDSSRVLDSLKNQKIPLFIVGLGDPANPAVIPIKRGPGETPAFMRDASGNLVKTKLNEPQLVKLAKETGGIYVRSTVTDPGLDQIRQRIKDLVPKDMDKGIRTRPIERLYYPLAAALALLLTWFILSERENTAIRTRKALLLFLLPCLLAAATGAKAADSDAAAVADAAQPAAAVPADNTDETSPAVQDKKSAKDKPAVLPGAVKTYNEGHDLQLKKDESAAKLYEQAINLAENNPAVRARAYQNLGVIEHIKARQEMQQSGEQVKGQNLDGALEKLSGSEKILDKAEEMYVKSMSIKIAQPDAGKSARTKTPEAPKAADDQKIAEAGNIQLEQNRAEVAIDQQKLLFDRDMIAALRKKIEELKKKQEEARKKTEEARNQQQQQKQDKKQQKQQNKDQQDQNKQDQNKQDQNKQDQNKQDQNKQDQNKQDQNKQDQNKQDQNKQDQNKQDQNKQDQNKQDQNKQDQNKQDQNKQDQNKQDQNKQDQNKQDQNKQDNQQDQNKQDNQQDQQSGKDQKQNADQAMKDAKKSVDELKDQAKKLEQKKIEQNAEAARKELDKAEEAKKESKPEKADKHMKEALKYLGADDNNKNDKNDKNKNGGNDKDKKDQKDKQDKNDQKDKKDQDKQNQQDNKQNAAQAARAAAAQEKEIDPQQAKALLEVMAGKEKNLRDALKEQQQKMYGQIKVEKDW